MCGIAGILDARSAPQPDLVGRMAAAMAHRGPDHRAVIEQAPVTLGHARLAIIDLDPSGNQPMALPDRDLWIVFNGEIYNFVALRDELEGMGVRFRTRGDTEVILNAYATWGMDFLSRLNGMFALALWDGRTRQLILARDRAGEKPLFFTRLPGGGLVFASELKALRLHPAVSDVIDPGALAQYLGHNYVLGDRCILQGVEKLPPAHAMVVEADGSGEPFEYWSLARCFATKRQFASEADAAEELSALLDDAVRLRMVSDVPLGAFLSGGIDSAAIVASMVRNQAAGSILTFSIGFAEKSFSELPEAQAMAHHLKVDHHARMVDGEMARILPMLTSMADEPFADTSIIPCWFLADFARKKVTVALSGDGGDELFAGYETYAADRVHRRAAPLVPPRLARGLAATARALVPTSFGKVTFDYKLKQFLAGLALPFEQAHASWREIFAGSERAMLLRPDRAEAVLATDPFDSFRRHFDGVQGCDWLDRACYVDIKTFLVDDVLVKVDRSTMDCSLEARAPFLDHRLIEFAAALPPEWKLKGGRKKHLLKLSQAGRLPDQVLNRPKRGFNAPVSHWLTGGLADMAYSATTSGPMLNWFRRDAIDALWAEHRTRRRDNSHRLGGLTMLGLWMEGTCAS
jgi:asparagine synthase (glutamine-hydrolysing)